MNKVFKKFLSFLTLTVALFMFVELFFETSRQSVPQIDGDLNNLNVGNLVKSENSQVYTKKKLAVIVPVRNCLRNVLRFVPHMTKFLNAHEIPHHIFMVQQEDLLRFNRAALINIGYLYTKDKFDYSVQHDIDLLPLNPKLTYEFPGDCVFHVMNSFFHPAKGYRNHQRYIGGVLIVPNEIFGRIGGMNNNFWGWDIEDNEFLHLLERHKITIRRQSKDIGTSYDDTFLHLHNTKIRPRDFERCNNQSTDAKKVRDPLDGVENTKFKMLDVMELTIEGFEVTFLNVELKCDREKTPWCDCGRQI